MSDDIEDRLMRPDEVAAYLAISTRQLRSLTNSGQIPYINVGRGSERESRRYERRDVDAFIQGAKQTGGSVTAPRWRSPLPPVYAREFEDLRAELKAKQKAKANAARSPKR